MLAPLAQEPETPAARAVRVCSLAEIPIGLGRAFDIAGRRIALFRTRRGGVFAVDNRCPHKGGPLAEGMLSGDSVVCPLHAFRYEFSTGQCDQPGACKVQTFPVSVEEGQVHIVFSPRDQKENA